MARGDRRELCLSVAEQALRAHGQPLTYKELWDLVRAMGLWDGEGCARPAETLYAYIYDDVKRQGQGSLFRFHRRGTFSLAEQGHAGVEGAVVGRRPEDAHEARERVTRATLPRQCGNCQYIEFYGPLEATMEAGDCQHPHSGLPHVRADRPACPHFRPRPLSQREGDRSRAAGWQAIIHAVNFCAQRGRTWEPLTKLLKGDKK